MRLWHQGLLPILPDKQLLSQHRECCALRGNGWGKKHATVNYVFARPYWILYCYHMAVLAEFKNRGWVPDPIWNNPCYRGKSCAPHPSHYRHPEGYISWYPEHDDAYYQECLENLRLKGAILKNEILK